MRAAVNFPRRSGCCGGGGFRSGKKGFWKTSPSKTAEQVQLFLKPSGSRPIWRHATDVYACYGQADQGLRLGGQLRGQDDADQPAYFGTICQGEEAPSPRRYCRLVGK